MKLLATFCLALLWNLEAEAQGLIWAADHTEEIGVGGGGTPYGSWQIAFDHVSDTAGAPPPSLNPATRILSMSLVTNDTGRTFVANARNEPAFAGFVAGLTDGANNYVRFQAPDTSSWTSQTEQAFLGRSSSAPDLAGYNITEIDFRVNNFYDWYFDGTYNKTLDYSLHFYGTAVPEPSTWALLGIGAAAALLLRRKARRHR